MFRARALLATFAAALLCALGVAGTPAHAAGLLPPLLTPPVLPTPPPSVAAEPGTRTRG